MNVLLVGAGVVGRAIAADHLRAGVDVWLADQDEATLRRSCDLVLAASDAVAESASPWGARIPIPLVHLRSCDRLPSRDQAGLSAAPLTQPNGAQPSGASGPSHLTPAWILIESIAERLDVKQAFFAEAEQWFDQHAVLTTNTSTLLVGSIASQMQSPDRLCGLHFFMPVAERPVAEVIPHRLERQTEDSRMATPTSPEVVAACVEHLGRLEKTPLVVRDSPGFVVNRLLAPYLNLALDLLCGGVDATTIRHAALRFGMPLSPLELIDLIGTRTAFDGGRVVWSAFPGRMDPSPLLPALVKRKLAGVASGEGFYRYDERGNRTSDEVSTQIDDLVKSYRHDRFSLLPAGREPRIELVADLFAAAIRCEAIAVERDNVCDVATLEAAVRGGLGWSPPTQSSPASQSCSPLDSLTPDRVRRLVRMFPNLKSIQL